MINETNILLFLMVFFRMIAFFSVVKVIFPYGTPNLVKIVFPLLCTFIMFPIINVENAIKINNLYYILIGIFNELMVGLLMGYITNLCFNFIKMGGQFLDIHVGFSMSSIIDPLENENVTLIENMLYLTAVLLFLLFDGHHMLIKAFIGSYNAVPIGQGFLISDSFNQILKAFIYFFSIGVRISLPVTLVILLINFVMGIASRTVPQLNVMILGLPIKIVIGLVVIIISLPLTFKLFRMVYEQIPKHIVNVLTKIGPFMLIFSSNSDKTEDATPKRKSDARKKGQVARSKELTSTLTLAGITLVLLTLGDFCFNMLSNDTYKYLFNYLTVELNVAILKKIVLNSLLTIFKVLLPVAIPIMIIGVIGNIMQTGFLHTAEPLKPKFSKLNPLKGFKNFFSARTLVDLIKNISVVSIIIYLSYKFCIKNFNDILNLTNLHLSSVLKSFNKIIVGLLFQISIFMSVIAVADYIFQRYQHNKDLKMSKQEVKEEYKQMEGDPQVKGKIRQKQREMASRRMMQSVPDATVIITNPTHFSVALKYNEDGANAPILVAKGADYVAFKIKDIAKNNNIPIYENKPLARNIFDNVELNSEIPEELFQAVAEILAFIYNKSSN